MFKRGGVYWCKIRHKGRIVTKSLETANQKLAQAIEAKIRADLVEGKFFEKSSGDKKGFMDLVSRFMEEHGPRVSVGMRLSYKSSSKNLTAFFGHLALGEISAKDISQYKEDRRKTGVKPATINRELAMLSKAFNLAIREWEWLTENPVSRVSKEKEDNQRDRWLTQAEEERLLSHCPPWLQEIVVFDLNTGMRLNEVLSMEWPWVDIFRRTVTIPGPLSKNGKPRTIPLNKIALGVLVERAKVRSIQSKVVFFNQAGTKLDKCNLGKVFRDALKKTGIEDFCFHCLRHTFATRMAQAGVDLYKISKLLGHRDIGTTQRYAHHYPESLRGGVDILENPENFGYNLATVGEAAGREFLVTR